ncbi:DUF2249 domain-containing protein [Leekyejoonella antrihumi]|uniref:DUF2249 domain-containing protein n=1 Tax=Leekyejoonella antrihumi TaxID=1660198 RepID=A0A563DTM2_9MICO|nr:DUF2249 domain-containing protein [Leekyejoonella antrihumi]TWP33610.1 DUF2249 domain-containing protein [Leekyejoonella antrihumi]
MPDQELDVRPLRKPDKHPAIFGTYEKLAVGESLVLVNNHDPKHLHDEFDRDYPGGYSWDYEQQEPKEWKVRIGKLAETALPRVTCDTTSTKALSEPDVTGAVWSLSAAQRDLDSAIVTVPAGTTQDTHRGPDHDLLVHVLRGVGRIITELGEVELAPGALAWLPRRSQQAFAAEPGEDLTYLVVGKRHEGLTLNISSH